MDLTIRPATSGDCATIADILLEVATWLTQRGLPMWRETEVVSNLHEDVAAGLVVLAASGAEAVGTLKFQLADPLFWPDVPDDGAYVHRLAVRRRFAGRAVSSALLRWAAERAAASGRRFLRLDCDASRPKLRSVYEEFGFRHHSDRQIGPFLVSRYEYPVLPSAVGAVTSAEPASGPPRSEHTSSKI